MLFFDKVLTINITANVVQWYGAIVATAAFFPLAYSVLRDRAKIKIEFRRNFFIAGDKSREKLEIITVINSGRRPVKIDKVAIRVLGAKGKYALLSSSLLKSRQRVLTEENPSTSYEVKQENDSSWKRYWWISVYDGAGREYKKYLHRFPTFWRIFQRIRHGY